MLLRGVRLFLPRLQGHVDFERVGHKGDNPMRRIRSGIDVFPPQVAVEKTVVTADVYEVDLESGPLRKPIQRGKADFPGNAHAVERPVVKMSLQRRAGGVRQAHGGK